MARGGVQVRESHQPKVGSAKKPPTPKPSQRGWQFRHIAILRAPAKKEWERWCGKEEKG